MTTTQNVAKSNTNNNVVAAATEADKRARRTPEEARQARLEREQRLAEKAAVRAKRYEDIAKKAKERAEKSTQRAEAIASNVIVPRERQEVPVIQENVQKRVQRDLKAALKEIGTKHGIDFSDLTPRLTQHGAAMSLRIVAHVAGVASKVRRAVGATREASRFLEHHKLVGIKPGLLGKEVQLAGEDATYKVMGLKGRAHDVVLQKVGGDEEVKTVPADDFKTRMVMA
jgi:hypothetical protein